MAVCRTAGTILLQQLSFYILCYLFRGETALVCGGGRLSCCFTNHTLTLGNTNIFSHGMFFCVMNACWSGCDCVLFATNRTVLVNIVNLDVFIYHYLLECIISLLITESDVTAEQALQMSEWLKNNIWPPAQVGQYTLQTAIHRAQWIRANGTKPIQAIIEEFPRLLDTPGMVSLHLTE